MAKCYLAKALAMGLCLAAPEDGGKGAGSSRCRGLAGTTAGGVLAVASPSALFSWPTYVGRWWHEDVSNNTIPLPKVSAHSIASAPLFCNRGARSRVFRFSHGGYGLRLIVMVRLTPSLAPGLKPPGNLAMPGRNNGLPGSPAGPSRCPVAPRVLSSCSRPWQRSDRLRAGLDYRWAGVIKSFANSTTPATIFHTAINDRSRVRLEPRESTP